MDTPINPVYHWSGPSYMTHVFYLPFVIWRDWSMHIKFHPPFRLKNNIKTVQPAAIKWLGDQIGWKDTDQVVTMLTHGVHFGVEGLPPGARGIRGNSGTEEGLAYLRNVLLPEMLVKSRARIASAAEAKLARISPITMIPKSTPGDWRMIHDLSCDMHCNGRCYKSVNDSTPHDLLPKVGLCRIQQVIDRLLELQAAGFEKTIHLASADLAQAYYQFPLHISQPLFLGFQVLNVVYLFMGLPFGAKASPATFVRLINIVWAYLCTLCIIVYWYMDDALVIGTTAAATKLSMDTMIAVLLWCGFDINYDKSFLAPVRLCPYLGVIFDLDAWCMRIKPLTLTKAKASIVLLRSKSTWNCHDLIPLLDSLIGRMNFMQIVIWRLRPLKHLLIGVKKHAARCSGSFYTLNAEVNHCLESSLLLLDSRNSWNIRSRLPDLERVHSHQIATDASETGFGGWGFDCDGVVHYFYGTWEDLGVPADLIIADLELLTHFMAVEVLLPVLLPGVWAVDVAIDNINARDWINNLKSKVDLEVGGHLRRLGWLRRYGEWMEKSDLNINAVYLDTHANYRADALTRPALFDVFFSDPICVNAIRHQIPHSWWTTWMR